VEREDFSLSLSFLRSRGHLRIREPEQMELIPSAPSIAPSTTPSKEWRVVVSLAPAAEGISRNQHAGSLDDDDAAKPTTPQQQPMSPLFRPDFRGKLGEAVVVSAVSPSVVFPAEFIDRNERFSLGFPRASARSHRIDTSSKAHAGHPWTWAKPSSMPVTSEKSLEQGLKGLDVRQIEGGISI
jgi:hypothetical protein